MKRYILALFCCLLLCGCSQERIVDRINIIQSMGVDIEGETYKISASFPAYIKATREQSMSPMTAESKVTYGILLL